MADTTITISQETRNKLFQRKDNPSMTYDDVLRELMAEQQPA